jgi:hypothetical protein
MLDDTGSRLAVLPPCLAMALGAGCAHVMLVPPGLVGPPSPEVLHEHAVRCLAAGLLLARWALDGMRSVRLEKGRLWPCALPPEAGSWAIGDADAQRVLVATVALGERYTGWGRAVVVAEREMGR